MNQQDVLWARVHEVLDAGADPLEDERVCALLPACPEAFEEVRRLCGRLDVLSTAGPAQRTALPTGAGPSSAQPSSLLPRLASSRLWAAAALLAALLGAYHVTRVAKSPLPLTAADDTLVEQSAAVPAQATTDSPRSAVPARRSPGRVLAYRLTVVREGGGQRDALRLDEGGEYRERSCNESTANSGTHSARTFVAQTRITSSVENAPTRVHH